MEKITPALLEGGAMAARSCEVCLESTKECLGRTSRIVMPLIEPYLPSELLSWQSINTPKGVMNSNLSVQLLISFCFFVSASYVSKTANAGFGVVITSLIYVGFSMASMWVVNKKPDPILVGLILGAGIILTFFSLLTAVFWGELSQCEVVSRKISKYSCREELKAAMKSVSIFATFMFLLQMSFTAMLFFWRTNVIASQHQYAEVPYGASESDEPLYVHTPPSKKQNSIAPKISSTNKEDFERLV